MFQAYFLLMPYAMRLFWTACLLLSPLGVAWAALPPFPTFQPLQSEYDEFEGTLLLQEDLQHGKANSGNPALGHLRSWQRADDRPSYVEQGQASPHFVAVPRRSTVVQATPEVVLTEDGRLWAWRENERGEITTMLLQDNVKKFAASVGNVLNRSSRLLVLKQDGSIWQRVRVEDPLRPVMNGARDIAAVRSEFYAMLEDGRTLMWGDNIWGKMQDLDANAAWTLHEDIIQITPATDGINALTKDGEFILYSSERVDSEAGIRFVPKGKVTQKNVSWFERSEGVILLHLKDGRIKVSGNNEVGSVTGFATESGDADPQIYKVRSAALSDYAIYAVDRDGNLFAWGADGLPYWGGTDWHYVRPQKLKSGVKSVGPRELALMENGDLMAWVPGAGSDGRNQDIPMQRLLRNVEKVWSEGNLIQAVQRDGTRWTWGYGAALDEALKGSQSDLATQSPWVWDQPSMQSWLGLHRGLLTTQTQLQFANDIDQLIYSFDRGLVLQGKKAGHLKNPQKLNDIHRTGIGPVGQPIRDIAAQQVVDFFLTTNGEVYKQFTSSAESATDDPIDMSPKLILRDITAFASGKYHLVALEKDGTLLGLGMNEDGQLGPVLEENLYSLRDVPQPIAEGVQQVVAGERFTAWLDKNGTAWVSGRFSTGSQVLSPTPVMKQVASLSAGREHLLLIGQDGQLYGTGSDEDGQLLGKAAITPQPTLLVPNIQAAQAGPHHSMYIQDGKMYAFGASRELGYNGDIQPILLHDGERWAWESH